MPASGWGELLQLIKIVGAGTLVKTLGGERVHPRGRCRNAQGTSRDVLFCSLVDCCSMDGYEG
jgi:hypothetical protein